MCTDYDILTKLSIAIVAAMPAKPSHDPSHLVAAVGSSSSAVVWTDPGCIDLQTAHGSSLSPRRSSNRRRDNSCRTVSVRLGDTCTPYLAVRGGRTGTARKSSIRQTVDLLQSEDRRGRPSSCTRWTLMAILLQGRESSEDRLPGCPMRRATQAQIAHGLLHPQDQCHWRVATEALAGSVPWNQVVRANSVELYSRGAVHLMCSGPANSANVILSRQTRLSQEKEDGV